MAKTNPAPIPVPGRTFSCPHCGQETIVRKKTMYDGWKATGDLLVCGLCGKTLDSPAPTASGTKDSAELEQRKKAEALLGTTLDAHKTLARDDDAHFCKNCRHYIVHPFQSRCLYWNRPVEPMSDCPKYEPKPEEQESVGVKKPKV